MKFLSFLILFLLVTIPASAQYLPGPVCDTLKSVRARYGPIPTPSELFSILNETAWVHREDSWGLSSKTGGNRCPAPNGDIACDILHRRSDNLIWDVLISAGEGSTPSCGNALGPQTDPARPWRAPIEPGTPTPPNPPIPPTPDLSAILARLADIDAKLNSFAPLLDQARTESFNAATRALETHIKLDVLLARPCNANNFEITWPVYNMRSPWGIGTFVLRPDPPTLIVK